MDLGLKGRLALITGSTRGLGRTIAETLAKEGVEVIINGRNEPDIKQAMYDISSKYNVQTYGCPVDVTDSQAIKIFFELGPIAAHGRLDILVNNVGNIEKFGSFTDIEDQDWLQCFNLTFMSVVRFTREAIPYLEQSSHGRIINISSLPSHQPGNFNPHYSAVKAAINNLTKHLSNILGSKNILVNAVCPSSLDGGGWLQNIESRAEREGITIEEAERIMRIEESNKSPLRKMGTLADVASQVTYLASDRANFLTGQIYNIDGGITKGF